MAQMAMGQLCTGSGFGRRWNQAWKQATAVVFGIVSDITIDEIPQDLFDQLIATAFWQAADSLGGVPRNVESMCTVPDRPAKSWGELSRDLAKWRASRPN